MARTDRIDWSDVEAAAKELAGNWQKFDCFIWYRASDLEDADRWMVWYTSSRDAGPAGAEQREGHQRAAGSVLQGRRRGPRVRAAQPLGRGACRWVLDPRLPRRRHDHAAFKEFCSIKERLDDYPILDEQDYSEREYEATLENYASELWRLKDNLPAGWEGQVYSWFCDHGQDRYIENRDDQGGYAPRDKIIEALKDMGLLPTVVVGK